MRSVWVLLMVTFCLEPWRASGTALAEPAAMNPIQIAQYINAAQAEVIVAAPVLRVPEVAEALRAASAKRGVNLKVLTGSSSLRDGASYFWVLKLAGAEVRTISSVTGFELILDRKTRITGDVIGRVLEPGENLMVNLESVQAGRLERFMATWQKAVKATGY